MSKQREALKIALEVLDSKHNFQSAEWRHMHYKAFQIIREALAEPEQEPELEFWPGDVLICKEDDSKVTVVHGNRGPMQLMNGKIAIAWNDSVGGEYTIEQIKEMFYRTEKPEQEPVAWMCADEDMTRKGYSRFSRNCEGEWNIPVYTAPPARKPLTDEQIKSMWGMYEYREYSVEFAREIELAHGIGA